MLWALGFVTFLMIGSALPWTFFVFMGFLMTVAAFHETEGREHLRDSREDPTSGGEHF
jgi:hypothetical protein